MTTNYSTITKVIFITCVKFYYWYLLWWQCRPLSRFPRKPITFIVKSSQPIKEGQPYGKVDMDDLQMTPCDFEKNANAEVLFDIARMTDQGDMERHVRIKI